MEKTIARMEFEWRISGNISRLKCALEREGNASRRILLAELLREQQELIATHHV